jgi:hypothetical protein
VLSARYPTSFVTGLSQPCHDGCHSHLLYLQTYKAKQKLADALSAGVWQPRKEADHGMGARHRGRSGNDPPAVDGARGHHTCTRLRIAPPGCKVAPRSYDGYLTQTERSKVLVREEIPSRVVHVHPVPPRLGATLDDGGQQAGTQHQHRRTAAHP